MYTNFLSANIFLEKLGKERREDRITTYFKFIQIFITFVCL